MKKIILKMVSVAMLFTHSFSQSIVTSQNFNSYDGTTANISANRSLSFIGALNYPSIATGSATGDTINNKSGADSATAITPQFTGGKSFSVYPVPSNGPVQITFDEPVKSVKFSIFNMIGNEIKTVSMEKLSDQQYRFNFRNQQPGFYFIRIQTDKFNYTTRITITASAVQKMVAPNA